MDINKDAERDWTETCVACCEICPPLSPSNIFHQHAWDYIVEHIYLCHCHTWISVSCLTYHYKTVEQSSYENTTIF